MNMMVMSIKIVIRALETISEGLVKELEDLEVEAIQTTALLRSARILRRIQAILGDLLSLKLQGKPSANPGVKISQRSNNDSKDNSRICSIE